MFRWNITMSIASIALMLLPETLTLGRLFVLLDLVTAATSSRDGGVLQPLDAAAGRSRPAISRLHRHVGTWRARPYQKPWHYRLDSRA